jgi:hypothetical protein
MKTLTWKTVFASMNPSPVFEAVAMFGEGLAMNGDECRTDDPAMSKQAAPDRLQTREAVRSSRRSATWSACRSERIATIRDARPIRMSR